jgi:hypothetical protein
MRCGKCGADLEKSAIICGQCGIVPYEPVVYSEPTWWGRLGCILLIACVALGGFFTIFYYQPPEAPCPKAEVDFCETLGREVQGTVTAEKLKDLSKYPKEMLERCIELKRKECY